MRRLNVQKAIMSAAVLAALVLTSCTGEQEAGNMSEAVIESETQAEETSAAQPEDCLLYTSTTPSPPQMPIVPTASRTNRNALKNEKVKRFPHFFDLERSAFFFLEAPLLL